MAELSVKLTPPPKSTRPAAMAPREFLLSTPTRTVVKHRLQLDEVDAKRLRLDPTPKAEDNTIYDYYTRVSAELPQDRRKLRVVLPYEETWTSVLTKLKVSTCDIDLVSLAIFDTYHETF